jgi:hypothetical protein
MIDYFAKPHSPAEAILRKIKGNHRRAFVSQAMKKDGVSSVPEAWKAHAISEMLKSMLQGQHPQARGGEDLPDLEDDEVEIARMTLLDSVHGEVSSLRARPGKKPGVILFRLVDEYETEISLPMESATAPLSEDQVLSMFRESDPSQTDTECEIGFQSYFYSNLDELARQRKTK